MSFVIVFNVRSYMMSVSLPRSVSKYMFQLLTVATLLMHKSGTHMAEAETVPVTKIRVGLYRNACLSCPIIYDEDNRGVSWRRGNTNTYLFRDNALTYNDENLQLTINKCGKGNYSMGVINVTIGFNDGVYACWKSRTLRAYFEVSVEVTPTVTIVGLNGFTREDRKWELTATDRSNVELQCLVSLAIHPLNITWSRNNSLYRSEQFDGPDRAVGNFISHLAFNVTGENENVTCEVNGPYIQSEWSSILVRPATESGRQLSSLTTTETAAIAVPDKEGTDVTYIMIPVLFGLFALMSVLMYLKLKNNRSLRLERTYATTTFDKSVDEVHYESPEELVRDVFVYGDKKALTRSDFLLVSSIPSTGKRKRWIASSKFKSGSSVVATTLRAETAKKEDWLNLRLLAEHLKHIPKHENVVAISACDTEQIPYYIYCEHVTNGTLRDILSNAKYEDPYTKTIYMHGLGEITESSAVERIGSFLLEPLKAIFFLESIDCDHIALCAGKVLMTPHMVCKLYDFDLRSCTKKIVANASFEESSRLQWFAPETIFERKYDRGSDVWSFAVFMWEVFSEGVVPFEGVDIKKFSSNPDGIPLLAKPRLCSDAVYAIMKSCLIVNPDERISLTTLKTKLFSLVEG